MSLSGKISQNSNMVEAISNLLKQVRLFGTGNDPLEEPEDMSLNLNRNITLAPTPTCPKPSPYQQIPYQNSEYSVSLNSSDYSNSFASSLDLNESVTASDRDNSFSSSVYDSMLNPSDYDDRLPSSYDNYSTEFCEKLDSEEDEFRERRRRKSKSREENRSPELPEISLSEVEQHDMMHDCWMVFYDKVYDVTQFLYEHPGGEDLLMEHAGRDATLAFRGVGHSKAALHALQQYLIGVLPLSERIFTDWEAQ